MVDIDNIIEKRVVKDTEKTFSQSVENRVWEKDITYLEAVSELMQEKNLEPSQLPKLISKDIKNILQSEAEKLSLLKRNE